MKDEERTDDGKQQSLLERLDRLIVLTHPNEGALIRSALRTKK